MWLLQDGFRNISELDNEANVLQSLLIEFQGFSTIPFTNSFVGLSDMLFDTPTFIRCGTKLLELITNKNLILENVSIDNYSKFLKGIYYNSEKFDQKNYSKLNLPLLNSDVEIYFVKDILHVDFGQDVFIKPSNDRKSFNAQFVEKGSTLYTEINNSMYQSHYINDICLVSKSIFNSIDRECRFFVVNGKVITGSHYRIKNKTTYKEININDDIWNVANEYSTLYSPESMFVIDIAQVNNKYMIVEYNCLNASGLYHSDTKKLFNVINEVINE